MNRTIEMIKRQINEKCFLSFRLLARVSTLDSESSKNGKLRGFQKIVNYLHILKNHHIIPSNPVIFFLSIFSKNFQFSESTKADFILHSLQSACIPIYDLFLFLFIFSIFFILPF